MRSPRGSRQRRRADLAADFAGLRTGRAAGFARRTPPDPEPAATFFDGAATTVFFSPAFSRPFSSVFAADFSAPSLFSAGLLSAVASFFSSLLSGCSARLRLSSLSLLKSVSYQPLPFKRNTGADTRRLSWDLPQLGHLRSGASEIFCMASRWWPQFAH